MTAICSERWVLHEQHESAISSRSPLEKHLESSPALHGHQHAIEGCKIVTTDHASTLFEMQRRLVPQGRPGLSLDCSVSQGLVFFPPLPHSYAQLSPPSSTPPLRCMRATIKCSHAQTPKGSRPASALLRTLSYSSRPSHRDGTQQHGPLLAPEMRTSTSEPGRQTFRRRWELAAPTTAVEQGIRDAERPKKSPGNLTPTMKIRAVATAPRAPQTPVT